MKRITSSLLALLLALSMLIGMVPAAYAAQADTIESINSTETVDSSEMEDVSDESKEAAAQEAGGTGVAKIGDAVFNSLDAAIASAQNMQSATIELLANTEITSDTLNIDGLTIKSSGTDKFEIKGLKAIAGTGITLENVYLNLTGTLNIGGTNTTLTNCYIRAKEVSKYSAAAFERGDYTNLTRLTGTNVTLDGCYFDGNDKDGKYFESMCLMPTSARDVTIKNCTFYEGWAAIWYGAISGKVEIDNCTFQNIYAYSVNVSEGTNTNVVIKNSTLTGWNSFGKLESVSFENCNFKWKINNYGSGYSTIALYTNTSFEKCTFSEEYADTNTADNSKGVYVDPEVKANGVVVEMNGCKVVDAAGNDSSKSISDVLNTARMGADTTAVVAIDATKDENGDYTGGTFVGNETTIKSMLAAGSTYDPKTGKVTSNSSSTLITTNEELNDAIANAASGDTLELAAGTFDLEAVSKVAAGKALNFVGRGADDTIIQYGKAATGGSDGGGGACYVFDGAGAIAFKDVTLQDKVSTKDYYRGFVRAASMSFENCKFTNVAGYWGSGAVVFKGCEFTTTVADSFNMKCYSGTSFEFDGCEFNSPYGFIDAYRQENLGEAPIITVNNCTFTGTGTSEAPKPAVRLCNYVKDGLNEGGAWDVSFTGTNTTTNVAEDEVSGSPLYGCRFNSGYDLKGKVSIDGVTVVDYNAASDAAAKIGDTEYETLDAAFKAAKDNDEIIINAGTYEMSDLSKLSNKTVTVSAAAGAEVVFDNAGPIGMGSASVTFKGITFDYMPNQNYTGLQHSSNMVYENCVFNGMVFLYGTSETFNSCTFNQTEAGAYNVWTYGAKDVKFNNCTFSCVGRCVLVYTEDENAHTNLTVEDTTFKASAPAEGKAAIEIDTRKMTKGGATITVDAKTTATGFAEGSNSKDTLWNDKGQTEETNKNTTVVVNGETVFAPKTYVAQVGETKYESVAEAINNAAEGATVLLLADTTEDVVINKNITLDLGGKTLTNTNAGKATLTVASGATVIVKNGNVVGGKSYYTIQNNGTATFEDVTATAGNTGSSMIDNYGTLTITSGTYTGGLDTVKNEPNATLTINGGTFTLTKGTSKGFTGVVFNYGKLTITGGEFTQSDKSAPYGQAQVIHTDKSGSAVPSTTITGGTFKNLCTASTTAWVVRESTAAAGATKVSGGTFNKSVTESYWAEGKMVSYVDGAYRVVDRKEAEINGVQYDTLELAVENVQDNETIKLIANVELENQLVINKNVTLNLNNKTLTSTYKIPSAVTSGDARYAIVNKAPLKIRGSGTIVADQARVIGAYDDLTLNNVKVTSALDGGHACVAFCKDGATYKIENKTKVIGDYALACFASDATVTISSATLTGRQCGLYHNGTKKNLTMTVKKTTINGSLSNTDTSGGKDPAGVYISGNTSFGSLHNVTFTGCTIKGSTAIEVKYTNLTLEDCTVTATCKTPSYVQNSNGMTALGFAVVNTDNTTAEGVAPVPAGTITITGAKGKYTGLIGLGSLESMKTDYPTFEDETINVSGGTFNHAIPEDYCAPGFIPQDNGDGTYGVKEVTYVAEVNGTKYETLQAAIDAAKSGTVKLIADTKENVTISKALTLDLNGYTLNGGTEKGKPALTITARTVTIKDSSAAQTGTIMREDTAENSGVSSHYVIDIQGNAWVMFESGNVKNNSGNTAGKGASLVRVGDDSVEKYPGLNIKGGTFTQDNFIVIKVDRGDLFLNGGTLNSANSYAIEDWHRATIKGGTVNGAVAAWTYSGGLNSDLTISGGTINGDVTSVNYGNAEGRTAKVSITGGRVTGELDTRSYNPATSELTSIDDATKATIGVTGGTFDKNPMKYVVEGSTVKENGDGTFGVEKAYLAKVGETSYYTMDEAFKAQTASGEPIILLRDYTTGSSFYSGSINRTVNLDGHTWTYTGTGVNDAAFEINYSDATLTVKNGNVVTNSMLGLIPSAMGGTITYDNAGLVFDTVTATVNGHSGIETNGNNTNDSVTLRNSTLNVPNGFGIYFPSSGTLTIENSKINAKTMGVQVCAGSLKISGDKTAITVTGDAVPKTENDGAIQDGAAISIVNRTGYKGLEKIEVTGGTFTAKDGNAAIKAYDWANNTATDFTEPTKVEVSGGTFSAEVPADLCAPGYVPQNNGDGTYGVKQAAYVAEYNGIKYESLQEAIDAASQRNGGQTEVTLLTDVTITETVVFAKKFSGGSVLLNLGGYTLTGNGCRAIQVNKGNLYLENGTVTSTGIIDSSSVIRIGSNEEAYSGVSAMLYMRNGAKVLAPVSYGVTIFGSKTVSEKLTVAGNASIEATGPSPAISGNGDKAYHVDGKGTTVTITGNAVVSATNNYAIYHPDNGTLNIQDTATISGKGGIQMCSGTLNISGSPKIEALGKADHETGAAGPIYDNAAISAVNRSYPGGAPVVTIKGTPTITNEYADGEVIHAFTWSNKAESEWAEAGNNINVSGGTYSKTFNKSYLAEGCTLEAKDTMFTVKQKPVAEYNGAQYTSLAQALLDARNSGTAATVKLLENVTVTNNLDISSAAGITLNLNKKTLTLDGAQLYTSGSAIINNGTIKRTDVPATGNAGSFAIQVMSGSSLILGAGTGSTYKVTLESTYGIYDVGGKLTVRYATINTTGWSIAVSDSASKTGEVYIGRGMGGNSKTVITSESGNVVGTMVGSKPNVTIDYGTLTSNGTDWDAGVVYWASEGILTISGGIFNASSAEGSEAAAVYQKNGTVKISGTTAKLLGNNALVVKAGEGSTGTMVTELSGGSYSTRPDDSWVVEGKEVHEKGDLYVVEGPYVVEVTLEDGTVQKFDSWSKAFYSTAAQEHNATVKLLKDIETTSTVTTWATVTIDFNGHTLTVNASGVAAITALTKGTAANVTLMDSVGSGGMKTTGVYGVTVRGTGATATVESGDYNCATSVVQVENGTAYIKGGTFKTEDADKSYLLNCIDEAFKAGTAVMEVIGGTFYGFDPSANPEGEGTTYVKVGYQSRNTGNDVYVIEKVSYNAYYVDNNGKPVYGNFVDLVNYTNDATVNKTITLLDNVTVNGYMLLFEGRSVDLSGFELTITKKLIANDGSVSDSSDGKGLLKIAADSATLVSNNGQIPLYDTENQGYRLFNCTIKDALQTISNTSVKLWVGAIFTNKDAYKLLQTGNEHNIKIVVTLRWKNSQDTAGEQTFAFTQSLINKVALTNGEDAFYIVLTGLDTDLTGSISEVTAQGGITSGTGVSISGEEYTLTK